MPSGIRAIPPVAAVVLGAGLGRRSGLPNKLLAVIDGKPIIRHVVEAAGASKAGRIVVIAGAAGDAIRDALADLPVEIVANPDFAEGMASSIRIAARLCERRGESMLVCLGDMPRVPGRVMDRLIDAHAQHPGRVAYQPAYEGRPGNPVLWHHGALCDLQALTGDRGARDLLRERAAEVLRVPVDDGGIHVDVDTPDDLAALGA